MEVVKEISIKYALLSMTQKLLIKSRSLNGTTYVPGIIKIDLRSKEVRDNTQI